MDIQSIQVVDLLASFFPQNTISATFQRNCKSRSQQQNRALTCAVKGILVQPC